MTVAGPTPSPQSPQMTKSAGDPSVLKVDFDKQNVFGIPVSGKWNLAASSKVKIRTSASHTTLCILSLLLILVIAAAALHIRLQRLSNKNVALEVELEDVKQKLGCVILKLQDPNNALDFNCFDGNVYQTDQIDDSEIKSRVKRSLDQEPIAQAQINDAEESNLLLSTPKNVSGTVRKRDRGINKANKNGTAFKEILRLKNLQLNKLKVKLDTARTRAKSAKELSKAYKNQLNANGARAIYLTMRDKNLDIQRSEQLIGPWRIWNSGSDLGFNDLWYKNLSLDYNATSVIFQENGLYLIYAQVYYKNHLRKSDRETTVGFRIHLKKGSKNIQRSITIAECVPAFPRTLLQTCFTQVCWYVEEGDKIYLEHYTSSTPVIEAEKMGQTFLGIVKLS